MTGKLLSKKDVLPICKQIANEHEGWKYVAEEFRNTNLKNGTLCIAPFWSFKISAQPSVVLFNKTANKLHNQIFNKPYSAKRVCVSITDILAPDATQDNQIYRKFVHTLDEAEEYIRDFFARGLKIIEEQYNYSDEKELIENAPFKQRHSPFEYCFGRLVLHDFDFFHKLRANDLKHYKDGSLAPIFGVVPRPRYEDLLEVMAPFVEQWEKNVLETGNVFGKK